MRFGIHLPQYGRAAGPHAIERAARQAEDLGFADVWVSDHLAVPDGAPYPPAFLFEPLMTLAWAAAATSRVGLGTSVLVLPYRHPLHLAKELASLDVLSGGRLVVGVAAGWLQGEFEALGVPFGERGARTDEAIDAMRACWEGGQPVSFSGPTVEFKAMKFLPRPDRHIPIWVGGASRPALERAVGRADGWHGTFMDPEAAGPVLEGLKACRPHGFVLSMRVAWDGLAMGSDEISIQAARFAAAGLDHLMVSPTQNDLDSWLASAEALWVGLDRINS